MPTLCHESCPSGSQNEQRTDIHIARADTSHGSWAGVWVVSPNGGCHLLGRTTRWEPRAAIHARVSASLGGGNGGRS